MNVRSPQLIWKKGSARKAFSLVEVLTAMAILSVIVFTLYKVFDKTQESLLSNVSQVDVMEAGRAASEIVVRDVEQMIPSGASNVVNFFSTRTPSMNRGFLQPILQAVETPSLGTHIVTNSLQEMFFLTRTNKRWMGIGYRVYNAENGVGVLHRGIFMTNDTRVVPTNLVSVFRDVAVRRDYTNYFQPVLEGVINFNLRAYSPNGFEWVHQNAQIDDLRIWYPGSVFGGVQYGWIGGPTNVINQRLLSTNIANLVMNRFSENLSEINFLSNAVPSAVEVEIGVLEPRVLEQFKSMGAGLAPSFLRDKAGEVQLFRKRIPVRTAPR